MQATSDAFTPPPLHRGDSIFDIQQSIDNEGTQTSLIEARRRFPRSQIVVLKNDDAVHLERNINRLVAWILQWRLDHHQQLQRQQTKTEIEQSGAQDHSGFTAAVLA